MSTTFEIERMPAPISRAFSHAGDSPIVTSRRDARDEARARLEIVDRDVDALVALTRGPRPVVPGIGFSSPPVSAATSRAIP